MTADKPAVRCECDPVTGIGRIIFNRPEVLNAVDLDLARGFAEAVGCMAGWRGLRCLILSGEGRAFMAGGDLRHFAGGAEPAGRYVDALLEALIPALTTLRTLDAPILASVQGAVAGAGLSFALNADLILAAQDAQFMLAYGRIGAVPDCGGSWLLPRRIGTARASEMMLLSRRLTTPEALDWGLINAVASEGELAAATAALALKLAQGSGRAHGAFRRLADASFAAPYAAHLAAEREAFLRMTATADFAEGVEAFLARRPARFSGA